MDIRHHGQPSPHRPLRYAASPWASVNEQQRRKMIADRAYFIALERNFEAGDPVADWLRAEAEIDEHLANELG